MSSDEITLHDGLNVFHEDPIRTFNRGLAITARPESETRDPTGFIDDKIFSLPPLQPAGFRSSSVYAATASTTSTDSRHSPIYQHRNRGSSPGGGSTNSGDDDEFDGNDEEDEDDELDGDEININKNNSSRIETVNKAGGGNSEKTENGKEKHSVVRESCRELVVKQGGQGLRECNSYRNAVTVADPDGDIYCSHSGDVSVSIAGGPNGRKDIVAEGGGGGCGFSGRKDVSLFESGDPLRAIFSDPVREALMDDAMILPCGHSFGAAGIQHVLRMKVCYTCAQSVSESSVAPNLSLRAAVQAFHREEELQFYRSPKRRKERFDQDKSRYGGSNIMHPPRSRGVQFPFAVADRGNKRTPPRFVGREAIVTTQCLNGWYVVKTLDNAESVKLQHHSLAKVPDNTCSKPISSKMGPNWL